MSDKARHYFLRSVQSSTVPTSPFIFIYTLLHSPLCDSLCLIEASHLIQLASVLWFRSQIADYYYDERICLLRCVLLLLTYFQDERHAYRVSSFWIRNSLFYIYKLKIVESRGISQRVFISRLSTVTALTNWRRTWWSTTSCNLKSFLMQKHHHGKLTAASWWDHLIRCLVATVIIIPTLKNITKLMRFFFVLFQDREAGVAVVSPVSERTVSAPGDHLSVFCLLWNEPFRSPGFHQNV